MKGKSLSRVQLVVTPWTAAYQAPPSMGFSRQEYWSGLTLPSPVISRDQPKQARMGCGRICHLDCRACAQSFCQGEESVPTLTARGCGLCSLSTRGCGLCLASPPGGADYAPSPPEGMVRAFPLCQRVRPVAPSLPEGMTFVPSPPEGMVCV